MSTTIIDAVKIIGGQATLAKTLQVSPQAVNQWVTGKRSVPVGRCRAIETATHGAVTRYDLRPDVFGDAPEPSPKKNRNRKREEVKHE